MLWAGDLAWYDKNVCMDTNTEVILILIRTSNQFFINFNSQYFSRKWFLLPGTSSVKELNSFVVSDLASSKELF